MFFPKELGFSLYSIATMLSPYDTGNLVYSIALRVNTPKFIKIRFPGEKASYTTHLEEGTATHGKHEGFIKNSIVPSMINLIKLHYGDAVPLAPSNFDIRGHLSSISKIKGYGKGKVTIGRSRYNKDTRATRRERSLSLARRSKP